MASYLKRRQRSSGPLGAAAMSAIVVLVVVGGAAGLFWARLAAQAGLVAFEAALVVPVAIAGVATGGMAGLAVAPGGMAVWDRVRGHTPIAGMRVVLACIGATALGAILYLGVVGGLVWRVGLILPDALAMAVASCRSSDFRSSGRSRTS